ncbi:MAG: hypothetical protein KZQ85_12150 [Candidatus Thiodiazotropha sp. (ex Myrtea sp. 'scaly one' KF741663)]|nr:hypothetical protein [Candidatus Thiodiazotropha sp. (ex Myrtea sp. 'scaly one' KF741663)]
MHKYDNLLRNITVILFVIIMASLFVGALAGVFESPFLAIFWYLALMGITMMILMTAVLAIVYAVGFTVKRYQRIMSFRSGEAAGLPTACNARYTNNGISSNYIFQDTVK